jgi:hypothetical protein
MAGKNRREPGIMPNDESPDEFFRNLIREEELDRQKNVAQAMKGTEPMPADDIALYVAWYTATQADFATTNHAGTVWNTRDEAERAAASMGHAFSVAGWNVEKVWVRKYSPVPF